MAYVSKAVRDAFERRLQSCINLIHDYGIRYKEIGIFGSYARNNYKATSDIDICIVTDHRPDMMTSGSLREELELMGADLVWVSSESFLNSNTNFMKKLRRDYRRIL